MRKTKRIHTVNVSNSFVSDCVQERGTTKPWLGVSLDAKIREKKVRDERNGTYLT